MLLLTASCSTKKDAFLNRKWHALNAQYNAIYNGNIALDEGRADLIAAYRDNYWDILPVERMEIREDVVLDGTSLTPNFERAEEKAVKAIQKHGMNIGGQEKNTQIDEAYLLLGQARYYDQRFIPALEAFNYILNRYRNSDIIPQAMVWREKTHIRLENDELAIDNLKKLLRYASDLRPQDYADANAMMAQAYINLEHKDSALQRLKTASLYTKNKEEQGRYFFIIGQLYNDLEYPDSAVYAFDKVIDLHRRTSREYYVNAHLFKIRNLYDAGYDKEELLELLTDLEENRENRPYLGMVYRQVGLFHEKEDSLHLAWEYYNKSLRAESQDRILNSKNYESMGKMAFDARDYTLAGAYYDSTLTQMREGSKEFRLLQRKRDNLQEVIVYEAVRRQTDSVMTLVSLSETERDAYFQAHIDSLIAEDEERKEQERIALLEELNSGGPSYTGLPGKGGQFYFYNPEAVANGRQEFRNRWKISGPSDNWRYGNIAGGAAEDLVNLEDVSARQDGDQYSLSYYRSRLPQTQEAVDSIQEERERAYFQLGLVYKEKFREYVLAASRLQQLLNFEPEERYVLPAKYNLYRIYEETGSPLAEEMKGDILENHPDSRYAQLLLNPDAFVAGEADHPSQNYEALYRLYEDQRYEEVIGGATSYSRQYNGEDIGVKFELLKAYALGKLDGVEAMKSALTQVALDYPSKPEGVEAARILESDIPALEALDFGEADDSTRGWKLVYPFMRSDVEGINALVEDVVRSLQEFENRGYYYSIDVYNRDLIFLVVHNAPSRDRAEGHAELLATNKEYLIEKENFVISSRAYQAVQVHKNLEAYLEQTGQVYPNLN